MFTLSTGRGNNCGGIAVDVWDLTATLAKHTGEFRVLWRGCWWSKIAVSQYYQTYYVTENTTPQTPRQLYCFISYPYCITMWHDRTITIFLVEVKLIGCRKHDRANWRHCEHCWLRRVCADQSEQSLKEKQRAAALDSLGIFRSMNVQWKMFSLLLLFHKNMNIWQWFILDQHIVMLWTLSHGSPGVCLYNHSSLHSELSVPVLKLYSSS